jgi:putative salt-induced outer membrane protein
MRGIFFVTGAVMTSTRQILASAAFALIATSAQADWKGKGEAGLVLARGNTDADTINFKLGMSEEVDPWKHSLEMAALRASTNGVESANRYMAGWQSDYKLNARTFAFGGLRYENDKFSGFDYQASASAGIGYKFYDTARIKLSGQAGLGYRRLKDGVTGASSGNAVFVAGMDYENAVTATTKIIDKFHAESGSDNTLLSNFLGVEVKMSDKLALSAGLDARQNTKPPAGKKKTDTITTLNLVYAF